MKHSNLLKQTGISSPSAVSVFIFSCSKTTAIPLSFNSRMYLSVSKVFLENLAMDLVNTMSISPLKH